MRLEMTCALHPGDRSVLVPMDMDGAPVARRWERVRRRLESKHPGAPLARMLAPGTAKDLRNQFPDHISIGATVRNGGPHYVLVWREHIAIIALTIGVGDEETSSSVHIEEWS